MFLNIILYRKDRFAIFYIYIEKKEFMTTGIYKITNLVNGKVYIGASKNIEKRWGAHRNGHSDLAKEFQTFGLDNFKFEILLECPEDMLCQWERDMICLYDADDPEKGYNSKNDRPYSLKRTEALKGRKLSEETKRKISESHKGKPAWNKGLKNIYSDESRRKISESHKGKPAWNKGIPHSEETRRKMSEALKGRKVWNKGIPLSEETRRKISEARRRRSKEKEV